MSNITEIFAVSDVYLLFITYMLNIIIVFHTLTILEL